MKTRLFAGTLIALGAITLMGAPIVAQDAPTKPADTTKAANHKKGELAGHGKMAKILQDLNLTDQQKTDLKPILKDRMTQARAIREDSKLTPEQKRDKMKELTKATQEKIAAILTPEQKAKLPGKRHKKGA
jgi:protein CpxP